jgi:hypothetical protein
MTRSKACAREKKVDSKAPHLACLRLQLRHFSCDLFPNVSCYLLAINDICAPNHTLVLSQQLFRFGVENGSDCAAHPGEPLTQT